jgi:hypothetical protein
MLLIRTKQGHMGQGVGGAEVCTAPACQPGAPPALPPSPLPPPPLVPNLCTHHACHCPPPPPQACCSAPSPQTACCCRPPPLLIFCRILLSPPHTHTGEAEFRKHLPAHLRRPPRGPAGPAERQPAPGEQQAPLAPPPPFAADGDISGANLVPLGVRQVGFEFVSVCGLCDLSPPCPLSFPRWVIYMSGTWCLWVLGTSGKLCVDKSGASKCNSPNPVHSKNLDLIQHKVWEPVLL